MFLCGKGCTYREWASIGCLSSMYVYCISREESKPGLLVLGVSLQ